MRVAHYWAGLVLALAFAPAMARAEIPIVTDSRIKTLVYNPNEVYTITTHYGYQGNVEFGLKERIETVSVGDRVAWQIIPAGRRLFIRAQEENAHTNMTVVTNLRAYQFDLRSSNADAVFGSEELTYVVRFFYPDEHGDGMGMHNSGAAMPSYSPPPASRAATSADAAAPISTGAMPGPAPAAMASASPAAQAGALNYQYTFSGPANAAPVKIYDDGQRTYFKFRGATVPRFAIISASGEEIPLAARQTEPNIVAVETVASRFSLRSPQGQVIVYNESNGA